MILFCNLLSPLHRHMTSAPCQRLRERLSACGQDQKAVYSRELTDPVCPHDPAGEFSERTLYDWLNLSGFPGAHIDCPLSEESN